MDVPIDATAALALADITCRFASRDGRSEPYTAVANATLTMANGEAWLRRVGLAGFGDRYPHQMSGGMRKRLALAQTLILSPDILLMDEPFSALDVQTRQLMENEVLALWAAGSDGRRAAAGPPLAAAFGDGSEPTAG